MNRKPEMTGFEQLAARWAQIRVELEALQNEEDQIKHELSKLDTGTHQIGEYRIQIQAPRRTLNKTKLAAAFPAEQYPSLYALQLDTKAAKNQIAPSILEQYTDTAANPVVILK